MWRRCPAAASSIMEMERENVEKQYVEEG